MVYRRAGRLIQWHSHLAITALHKKLYNRKFCQINLLFHKRKSRQGKSRKHVRAVDAGPLNSTQIAVITVEPQFVYSCMQTRLMGQYNGNDL